MVTSGERWWGGIDWEFGIDMYQKKKKRKQTTITTKGLAWVYVYENMSGQSRGSRKIESLLGDD